MSSPIIKIATFASTLIASITGIINGTLYIAEHGSDFLLVVLATLYTIGIIEPVIAGPIVVVLIFWDFGWDDWSSWGYAVLSLLPAAAFLWVILNIGISIEYPMAREDWFWIALCCLIGIVTVYGLSRGLYEHLMRKEKSERH